MSNAMPLVQSRKEDSAMGHRNHDVLELFIADGTIRLPKEAHDVPTGRESERAQSQRRPRPFPFD